MVQGRRYYVLKSSAGYSDWGYASWYGPGFDGKLTASGERYDMHAMTAANKVLPLPTWVRVTDLLNHRSVVVKVNDRGPFHPGRIIDLSYAAAKKLGIIGKGSDLVVVRALNKGHTNPPPRHAVSATKTAQEKQRTKIAGNGLYLQAGAFRKRENAREQIQRLSSLGLSHGFILHSDDAQNLYSVRLGPYRNTGARSRAARTLQEHHIKPIRINQ